jgi:flagellin
MSISIQTNVTSLFAQQALAENSLFESKTIQQLTSGYRINSSGDDAAGLAVANLYRSQIAELQQGVRNANDGIGVFQTIDGGLNIISQIVDRLRTLATQSASATFAGDRSTLNNEYQSQLAEINRQAANVGLATGGKYNTLISVYIGGASSAANAKVNVDLSGANNGVDTTALGLATTSIAGGGVGLTGNSVRLDDSAVLFAAGGSQTFTFHIAGASGAAATVAATVSGGSSGLSGQQVIDSLNSQLQASGITASIGSDGTLQFSGSVAFTLGSVAAASAGNSIVTATSTIPTNTGNYNINSAFAAVVGTSETLTFQNANGSYNVTLDSTNTTAALAVQTLNTALAGSGITAVVGANGTDVNIQSSNAFSVNQTAAAGTSGGLFAGTGAQTVTAPSANANSTGNAVAALAALTAAVSKLGLVQGRVGAGENVFSNAINLASTQITNLSSAQSAIRDADVAAAAANLTKAQTLLQSSIAALAQANAVPAAVLKLLQ